MKAIGYSDDDIAALPERVQKGEYTLKNVLEDAKKMQDKGLVQPGYGFYPRASNGPDFWMFYTSMGGTMEENGKLVFDKAAMQLTPDNTTIGNPAESIEFSVRWGEECLVGQVGPSIGAPVATVLPGLSTGGCLIGQTRAIDW